jgi:hypothetical protein
MTGTVSGGGVLSLAVSPGRSRPPGSVDMASVGEPLEVPDFQGCGRFSLKPCIAQRASSFPCPNLRGRGTVQHLQDRGGDIGRCAVPFWFPECKFPQPGSLSTVSREGTLGNAYT